MIGKNYFWGAKNPSKRRKCGHILTPRWKPPKKIYRDRFWKIRSYTYFRLWCRFLGWDLDLRHEIWASRLGKGSWAWTCTLRLGFGLQSQDLGFRARIWPRAWYFWSWGRDLTFEVEAGNWALRLGLGLLARFELEGGAEEGRGGNK